MKDWKQINWKNPEEKVSKYFSVKECLWLPRLNRIATEEDGLTEDVKKNIFYFANNFMDNVREVIGCPVHVINWFRPDFYNKMIGGAEHSEHKIGCACDWIPLTSNREPIKSAKNILKPLLNQLKIRMEDNGENANWIHNDNKIVEDSHRFFKP